MIACEINFGTEREERDVCDTGKSCENNDELLKQIIDSMRSDQQARHENMKMLLEQMNNATINSQEQMQEMVEQMQEQTKEMIEYLSKPSESKSCYLYLFCW